MAKPQPNEKTVFTAEARSAQTSENLLLKISSLSVLSVSAVSNPRPNPETELSPQRRGVRGETEN
ncbi:MAG TPA: hypothetical protein VNT76_00560, partial [Candidatus Binatus sp.]|nr:hypothetical protein [Candidatus Binatus sp.]